MTAPNITQAINAAFAFHQAGQFREAESCYRDILERDPENPDALHLLGTLAFQLKRNDEAIALIARAIEFEPRAAIFHAAYGQALAAAGKLPEAIAAYRQSLALGGAAPEVHYNLGCALLQSNSLDDAANCFKTTLALRPDFYQAHLNLSNILRREGDLQGAMECCQAALAANPAVALAHFNLGQLQMKTGELTEAIASFDRALELDSGFAEARSGKIYAMEFQPGVNAQTLLSESLLWNERHARPLMVRSAQNRSSGNIPSLIAGSGSPRISSEDPGASAPGYRGKIECDSRNDIDRTPDRRLRIGYVSPDFRRHVAGFYLLPLLREHDHDQFEIFCYSNVQHPDAMTDRFRAYADNWRDISKLDDATAAALIREDRIDILLDTTMHMGGNRLLLFARKPAPVQATFCAYPGTTGLETMDYRLTDPYLDPPGTDSLYAERSIRLPDSFWCYDPIEEAPAVGPLPAGNGGAVTFGCLNNICKVNSGVLALWAAVMRAVPESRLLMLAPRWRAQSRMLGELRAMGIEAACVSFVEHQPRREYLATYNQIDIGLDTFPYNGHTTSLDAFWMGVPVVTLVGQTAVGRAGLSQLTNLGLSDLVATSEEQFVAIAAGLANDLPRLTELRRNLRQRVQHSSLADAPCFARNTENALRRMWGTWRGDGKRRRLSALSDF